MSGYIQGNGLLKVGINTATVDVSADVFKALFSRKYDLVEKPATFASARKTKVAGAFEDTLTISFEASNGAGASAGPAFDQIMEYALFTGTQTLAFEFTPDATGQKVTGTATIPEYSMGGDAQSLRKQDVVLYVLTSTIA